MIFIAVRLIRQSEWLLYCNSNDYIQNKKRGLSFIPYCIGISSNESKEKKTLVEINSCDASDEFLGQRLSTFTNYKYKGEFPDTIHERLERSRRAFLSMKRCLKLEKRFKKLKYIAINKENQQT